MQRTAIILAVVILLSGAAAAQPSNSTLTNSTSTPATKTTSNGGSSPFAGTGFGVVDIINQEGSNQAPAQVIHTYDSGVIVHEVEWFERPDYALVTVTVPANTEILVADSGKIRRLKTGSVVVRSRGVEMPEGTYKVKVRASAGIGGDQTISIAHGRETLGISDDDKGGGAILPQGTNEYVAIAGGGMIAILLVVGHIVRLRYKRSREVEVGP